ncbi:hypothetical protein, partial [Pseudomonas putida]|uniref:hypothetical protein n=1 Tax=Pseudomonas putida TaxID=303 RepID=UPI001C62BAFF
AGLRLNTGLWERPCVAKGPRSGPGIICIDAEIPGLLCSPFATQGHTHGSRQLSEIEQDSCTHKACARL